MGKEKITKTEEERAAEKEIDELSAVGSEGTTLTLSDSEYDALIEAIRERNRLSDFISDAICRGYKERSLENEVKNANPKQC